MPGAMPSKIIEELQLIHTDTHTHIITRAHSFSFTTQIFYKHGLSKCMPSPMKLIKEIIITLNALAEKMRNKMRSNITQSVQAHLSVTLSM